MKKMIKADLCDILRLVPMYQPVTAGSIDLDIAKLLRCEYTDYLFLSRREKSYLFDLSAVYTEGSYENLVWMYGKDLSLFPAIALFLHVVKTVEGRPWGSVTLLDYQETAQDVETFSVLSKGEREKHTKDIVKHCTMHTRYCTISEVIQYLKTGRC
ncbi:MAG TPA: hypothetical protein VN421_09655 [Pseudoflavonifractor sp.]|nr:hypothetical protein [Pseudoflavonifractor sp.]